MAGLWTADRDGADGAVTAGRPAAPGGYVGGVQTDSGGVDAAPRMAGDGIMVCGGWFEVWWPRRHGLVVTVVTLVLKRGRPGVICRSVV